MTRYFQLSDIKKVPGQCPLYDNCRTGRDLPPEFCAEYRCNTFYQVNTIAYFNDLMKKLQQNSIVGSGEDNSKDTGVARIVEQHLSGSSNGNGHSKGNGESRRTSIIAANFSTK